MNPDLDQLQPYPFERLAKLRGDTQPPSNKTAISLSIGEPKHAPPSLLADHWQASQALISGYPATRGTEALRQSIANWLQQRFGANSIDANQHILPVNGTREALFALAQCVVDRSQPAANVVMPNPFYQIYEGAALLAGARPVFLDCTADNHFLPNWQQLSEQDWQACQLIYICSPGNPAGAVIPKQQLKALIELADKHDFIIASDECYSELYPDNDNPPTGLLQVCAETGRHDFSRCVVFHSLSKRSNLPGLRSGFVAGDAKVIQRFLQYRTYHGCAMPLHHQAISQAAWSDEDHVEANHTLYREKFDAVLNILDGILDVSRPDAGFYLWPQVPDTISDTEFALGLYATENVAVLPGSYLSREANGINPGAGRVRMALVAPLDDCIEAANRIRNYCQTL